MAGEIACKLTAGEAGGRRHRQIGQGPRRRGSGTEKISTETRKLQKEQEDMGRMAQRVLADIQTPLEKYAEKMADLQTLVENGKLSQEDYARAAKQAGDEMEKAGQKGEKAFSAEAVGMAEEFLGALGFAGGIAEGVKLIKEQWEQVEAVEKRVSKPPDHGRRAAKFREAAGFGTIAETHQAEENLERMSTQTGVAGKDLYLTAASAMGDRRGLSRARTMEAVQEAAAEFPADAAAREEFSKQLVGVMGAATVAQRGRRLGC